MAEDSLVGTKLKEEKYELTKLLGESTYARVFLAKDLAVHRTRVVKEIRTPLEGSEAGDELMAGFLIQAQMLMNVSHPTLPRIFDSFVESKRFYLVREFIEGKTLDEWLKTCEEPPLENQFKSWAAQLCDIFSYLHTQSPPVIFGGLKPSNILITPVGRLRIMDYGNLRFLPPEMQESIRKELFQGYLPPEAMDGYPPDELGDIYNLGALLYQILTGRDPGAEPLDFSPIKGKRLSYFDQAEKAIKSALRREREYRISSVAELKGLFLGKKVILADPKMEVDVGEINYVNIPGGQQMVQGSFKIKNVGGGILVGRLRTDVQWVKVLPEFFQDNEHTVEFVIHTTNLPPGERHQANIIITTPQETRYIPIAVSIHPQLLRSMPDSLAVSIFFTLPFIHGIALLKFWLYLYGSASRFVLETVGRELAFIDIRTLTKVKMSMLLHYKIVSLAFLVLLFPWLCPLYLSHFHGVLATTQRSRMIVVYFIASLLPSVIFLVAGIAFYPNQALQVHPQLKHLDLSFYITPFTVINVLSSTYYLLPMIQPIKDWLERRPVLKYLVSGTILLIYFTYMTARLI